MGSRCQLPLHRLMTPGRQAGPGCPSGLRAATVPFAPEEGSALHGVQHPREGGQWPPPLGDSGPHGGQRRHPEGTAPGRGRGTGRSTGPDRATVARARTPRRQAPGEPGRPRPLVRRPLTRSLGRGPRSRRGAGSSGSEAAAGLRRARRAGPVYTRDRRRPRPRGPAPHPARGPAPHPSAAWGPPCARRKPALASGATWAPLNAPAVPSHRALICWGQTQPPSRL